MAWGPQAYPQQQQVVHTHRCATCGFEGPPTTRTRIHPAGWVIFAFLAITLYGLLFCWVGLLIKERYQGCVRCGGRTLLPIMKPAMLPQPQAMWAPAPQPERIIERQVVVMRCRYCGQLTPADLSRCRNCGAGGFS